MSQAVAPERPWGNYSRRRLRPGTSYPVKQGEIERALRSASASVGELIMWLRDDRATRRQGGDGGRRQLLAAHWTVSDSQLWIFGVPSDRRAVAHALLLRQGLPAAGRWLAKAPRRGNVWAATRHELAVFLIGADLLIEEH